MSKPAPCAIWPEVRHGEQYAVDLAVRGWEVVTVQVQSDEDKYVAIVGIGKGQLFDRVLGRVVHELAAASDNLMIYRWDR
jgi:hypothetical protein